MFSYLTKTKDKQSLKDPSALTDYYMDTFLCTEFQLNHAKCMEEFQKLKFYAVINKRKKHNECNNYFDEYKACLIGINLY